MEFKIIKRFIDEYNFFHQFYIMACFYFEKIERFLSSN